jgi:hypothetical protein
MTVVNRNTTTYCCHLLILFTIKWDFFCIWFPWKQHNDKMINTALLKQIRLTHLSHACHAVFFETEGIPISLHIFTMESHYPLSPKTDVWVVQQSFWIWLNSSFLVLIFNYTRKLLFINANISPSSVLATTHCHIDKERIQANATFSCSRPNRKHRNIPLTLLCILCQYVQQLQPLNRCASIVVHFWMQFISGLLFPISENQTCGILLPQITCSDNTEQSTLMDSGYYVLYEY